ncbi:MAG: SRPBCC family protein [Ignavibacteria bacterium]|nr:SRPBCC family protein [Ignavibacteria bacterium]
MTLHHLRSSLTVPLPVEEVFPFFAAAENLERITPGQLRFSIVSATPLTIARGTIIEYRLSLYGMRFRWTTLISVWEPTRVFVDEQRRGPFALWRHRHSFEETASGTTIRDSVEYALPLHPFGEVALPLVRAQLRSIFTFRQRRVVELLGLLSAQCAWEVDV